MSDIVQGILNIAKSAIIVLMKQTQKVLFKKK